MLITPALRPIDERFQDLARQIYTNVIAPGVIVTNTLGAEFLWFADRSDTSLHDWDDPQRVPTYGVCDTPEQFLELFEAKLNNDPLSEVCVFLTHHAKNPGETGGWRWHKWGEYVGTGEPTTEYLADEDRFDAGIYTFRVCLVTVPEVTR